MSNALKYSPDDGQIQVKCELAGDQVKLQIENGGLPIPPDKIGLLFEPFQRGEKHADSVSRSVGLGLYIVRQIVEAHRGRITVRSTHHEGTRFEVVLPLRVAV